METDSLSYKTLRNSSYFIVGFVFPIVFSVFVTPIVVHKLGVLEYGIYILANTVSSFLNLLDLGLSAAATKYLAEYFGRGDRHAVQKLLSSVNSLFVLIGLAGFFIYAILGKWFLFLFKIPAESQQHIFVVFLLAGVIFLINGLMMAYSLAHSALQRFDLLTKIGLVQIFALNLGMLAIVLLGFRLKAIMLYTILTMLVQVVLLRFSFKKILPGMGVRFSWAGDEITKAYKFGIQASVANIAYSALMYFDRLLIPSFLGTSALSYYSLPGNVAQKTSGLTNSLAGMMLPMASNLQGSGEEEKIQRAYSKIFRNLTIVAAGATVAIVLFANKILFYWLGADFAQKGTGVLVVLALTYFILSLYAPLHSFLLGIGKLKFLVKNSLFMAAINLLLLVILLPKYGIIGAAWAYLIGVLPVAFMFYWVETRYLKIAGQLKTYLALYAKIIFTALVFAALVHFLLLPLVTSFSRIVIIGPLAVLAYFFLFYIFGFADKEDVEIFKSFFSKFLIKKFIS